MIDMDAYDKLQLANDGEWRTVAEQPPVNTEKAATAFGFLYGSFFGIEQLDELLTGSLI